MVMMAWWVPKHYGASLEKSTGAMARRGRADGVLTIFSAQIVDPFVEPLEGLTLFAIQQGLLPAGALQRAGADAEQAHRFAGRHVLAQQIADDFENFFVKTGRRRQGA